MRLRLHVFHRPLCDQIAQKKRKEREREEEEKKTRL